MSKITAKIDQNGRPDMNYSLGRIIDWCKDNVYGSFDVTFVKATGYNSAYAGYPKTYLIFTVESDDFSEEVDIEEMLEF